MERRKFAVWSLLSGVLLGLVGTVFFYDKPYGLSWPLFALVTITVVLLSARRVGLPLRPRILWPLLPLLFFAGMVAVRDDTSLLFLNMLAIFGLGALVLHYLPEDRAIDQETFSDYLRGSASASAGVGFAPLSEGLRALDWLQDWLRGERPLRGRELMAVGRGLLLTAPLVLVFALLLGAADAVFGDFLYGLLRVFDLPDGEWIERGMLAGLLAWLGCGAVAYGVGRWLTARDAEAPAEAGGEAGAPEVPAVSGRGMLPGLLASRSQPAVALAGAVAASDTVYSPSAVRPGGRSLKDAAMGTPARRAKKHPFVLSIIEASMMLGAVDALFGAFVLVQFAYFFGGQANIHNAGFTYAEYARRGFFELVAVSVLTLGLVLWLDWVTVRHNARQVRLFRALAVAMVALTGVMLWSASSRMTLYEQAFGLTHLRVYTHVFMFWLAVLFVIFLLALFRVRERVFSIGLLAVVIGYLGTMNLINVDAMIAGENVARYLADPEGNEIDICYLTTMSADAVPAMIALFQSPQADPEVRELASWWLYDKLQSLEIKRRQQDIFSFNLSRESAWQQLNAIRETLPPPGRESQPYCSSIGYFSRF